MPETRIVSFVVRFVQQEDDPRRPAWRGLIRHVQSREELHFQMLPDALRFMNRFVDLAGAGISDAGNVSDPARSSESEPEVDN